MKSLFFPQCWLTMSNILNLLWLHNWEITLTLRIEWKFGGSILQWADWAPVEAAVRWCSTARRKPGKSQRTLPGSTWKSQRPIYEWKRCGNISWIWWIWRCLVCRIQVEFSDFYLVILFLLSQHIHPFPTLCSVCPSCCVIINAHYFPSSVLWLISILSHSVAISKYISSQTGKVEPILQPSDSTHHLLHGTLSQWNNWY